MSMRTFEKSNHMHNVHVDIRGAIYQESLLLQQQGIDVLRLNTGNPAVFDFAMPDSVRQSVIEGLDKGVAYSLSNGMLEAREAIADYHGRVKGIRGVTPDDVYIGNGVSELVQMTLTALLNTGDEILIPTPDYPIWTNTAWIVGANPVHYICDEQSDWMPDIADIKSKITDKTRAIVLINPNNPTGALYPREVLESIIEVAREHDLVIFSDEIYDRLVMDEEEHVSTASLCDDLLIITTNGLSKSHIICGFRCGWVVVSGAKDRARGFLEGMTQLASLRLCSNTLSQLVVPAALADNESTQEMVRPGGRLYEQRAATLAGLDKLKDLGVSYVKPKAAFYLFPKIDIARYNITNDTQFCIDLLREKHIMLINGRGFNLKTPDHVRIIMLPEKDKLTKAMADLGDFLSSYRQK